MHGGLSPSRTFSIRNAPDLQPYQPKGILEVGLVSYQYLHLLLEYC